LKSPIYWHPFIYRTLIRGLYGRDFHERYEILASLIESGSTVVEACMGDGYLYQNYLRDARVDYLGLDINEAFVAYARKRNIRAEVHDLRRDDIPAADFVIIQGSLHQFIPHHEELLERLRSSARKKLIVSEPVRNLISSDKPAVAAVARALGDPGVDTKLRFNEETFAFFCEQTAGFETIRRAGGGRDMIATFSGLDRSAR
jgi:SAM-dependent methyltransferase